MGYLDNPMEPEFIFDDAQGLNETLNQYDFAEDTDGHAKDVPMNWDEANPYLNNMGVSPGTGYDMGGEEMAMGLLEQGNLESALGPEEIDTKRQQNLQKSIGRIQGSKNYQASLDSDADPVQGPHGTYY